MLFRGERKPAFWILEILCTVTERGRDAVLELQEDFQVSQIGQVKSRECIYVGVMLAEIGKGSKSWFFLVMARV